MGEARDVMNRLTDAIISRDFEAAQQLYASDAVAVTPDEGEIRGNAEIVGWLRQFLEGFPDAEYESVSTYEAGDTAIDEGYLVGTNTGPLALPDGASMPATGRSVRLRSCDIATVEGGVVRSHRFYFDQVEFLGQLGLMEEPAAAEAT